MIGLATISSAGSLALVILAAAVALLIAARFTGPAAPPATRGAWWTDMALRYGAAVILVALGTVLRLWLMESVGPLPTFVTLYPAVLLAASLSGGGPGIMATVLSALAADYYFFDPPGFGSGAANDRLALEIFSGANLFLCVLAERLRRARWAAAVNAVTLRQAEELARQNDELSRQSEELAQQNEELAQQSEELTQQNEEVAQQAEELAQQNEELQSQSEEIQTLNAELQRREDLLQSLLNSARRAASEQTVLNDICKAALPMFGPHVSAVVVYEKQDGRLAVRAHARVGPAGADIAATPLEGSFAALVLEEGKTACLADASLRPDLALLDVPGEEPFRAAMASPLRTHAESVGLVAVYSRQTQAWTDVQFRLTEWLADQAAQILELLQLQESLRLSETRYRSLFDGMTEGFALHEILCDDTGAPVDSRFLEINPAFERLTGLRRVDVVGKTLKELLPDEDPAWVKVNGAVALTGVATRFEYYSPVIRRHYEVFSYRPAPRQFAVVFMDITERKRAEEALGRFTADLTRSNKDLEQFAYVTSHDLKEPLRMVTAFMGLLQDHCLGRLDAQADEYIAFASDAAARMQVLIDDLLSYSRAGRSLATEPIDVGAVLDGVLRNVSISIEEAGAVVTRDPLPTIAGNAVELTQVFQNLVGNALKFRAQTAPKIHIGAERKDGCWQFSVGDNGIGIDPQFADRIFMIFQRLHTREQYSGTGIGLAICRKIVEHRGGRIWVDSAPGKGSAFHFTLPVEGRESP